MGSFSSFVNSSSINPKLFLLNLSNNQDTKYLLGITLMIRYLLRISDIMMEVCHSKFLHNRSTYSIDIHRNVCMLGFGFAFEKFTFMMKKCTANAYTQIAGVCKCRRGNKKLGTNTNLSPYLDKGRRWTLAATASG